MALPGISKSKAVFMTSRGRSLARLLIPGVLLLASSPAAPLAAPRVADQPTDPQARYDALRPPEVRLRKLHLVRPDLIPYPIAYEVYC